MHTLLLPPHLWARSCSQFWSFEYPENEKVSKQAKVIMPNILHITAPQLTELEQTGQSTVEPITVLFGFISVHAVGNFSTCKSALITRIKIPEIVFFVTEIT
jgi:hypothetical protein